MKHEGDPHTHLLGVMENRIQLCPDLLAVPAEAFVVARRMIGAPFEGRPLPEERVTEEMWDLVSEMLEDPEESWWVALEAMKALTRADRRRTAGHVDRLFALLKHDDWWMHTTAMRALTLLEGSQARSPRRQCASGVADCYTLSTVFGCVTRR